ncbi:MAG: HlyD family secretion protein [Acidocella sp.]|nr:HlyD family secretion protein [Acidocella sp.]
MSNQGMFGSIRRVFGIAAGVVVLVLLLVWLVHYLLVGQYIISTDDAYIEADSAVMAPKISGYVSEVLVKDNQPVTKGQLLATIDDKDYQAAQASAAGDVAAAQATVQADTALLALQQAKIAAAQALVAADQARLNFAGENQGRYARASAGGATTEQAAEQAVTDTATAKAALAADDANLLAAQRQVNVLNAQAAEAAAGLAQAQAHATQASLDLGHTKITAPFDGVIANKTVAAGDYLQPGTEIMAVVPLAEVYVQANYKETQITRIQPGQKVSISVDGYPDLRVTGTVESIAPSSGQEFALLPPDNATGNFTKIVQRLPVKIDINLTAALTGKLRPGMSVEADIDTRSTSQN